MTHTEKHEQRPAGLGFAARASPSGWPVSGHRRRPPAAGALAAAGVLDGRIAHRGASRHARWCAQWARCSRQGGRRRPRWHDGLRRRRSGRRKGRPRASTLPLRRAATDAARDGVHFVVDSGWRSAAYQEELLHEAVLKYGSEAEAARWVATPSTSAHVSGARSRHRRYRRRRVAVRARRRVRPVPDLRQRAVALRAAPGGHRSRLPGDVRQPDEGSTAASAMSAFGTEPESHIA